MICGVFSDPDTEQSRQADSHSERIYILLCCNGFVHGRVEVHAGQDLQGPLCDSTRMRPSHQVSPDTRPLSTQVHNKERSTA